MAPHGREQAGRAGRDPRAVSWRVLGVLDAFTDRRRRLTLSEISRSAGLPLSTTHRLVAVLCGWGALERAPDGRYEVGRRIWELGLLAPVQAGLRQVAAPCLQDLFAVTRQTVYLAVREGTSALYVDRVAGQVAPRVLAQVGSRLPLHATGVGKVLLAHAPRDVRDEALSALRRLTPYTIVHRGRLEAELEAVREHGYARTHEEAGLGSASVAVPVPGADGREPPAAVGVVTAELRRDLVALLPALRVTARSIARALRGTAEEGGRDPG